MSYAELIQWADRVMAVADARELRAEYRALATHLSSEEPDELAWALAGLLQEVNGTDDD